jgi:RNA polymerase sigma factor (sigma-70 family)
MATGERSGVYRQVQTVFSLGAVRDRTDAQLLKAYATGSGEPAELAFAALVERHGPMVLRTCRGILRDQHLAEDAFQATFLVLVQKSRSLWVQSSLGPWLQQVAYRAACCARSALVARAAHERNASANAVAGVINADDRDDWDAVLYEELQRLPERFRVTVVLCDLEGCTHEHAASQLGCPVGTVKSRLARGRERLRERLIRRGHPGTPGSFAPALAAPAVPAALGDATVRTAAQLALAESASASIAAPVRTLVDAVLRIMFRARLKGALLTSLMMALGATALGYASAAVNGDDRAPAPLEANADPRTTSSPGPATAGKLAVTGTVIMPDGTPARHAIVASAVAFQEPGAEVRTDEHGRFRLEGVFGNGVRLAARSTDGALQATRLVPADSARDLLAAPIEVRLMPAITHELTVVGTHGPVANALVVAVGDNFKARGVTGTDGKVRLQYPASEKIDRLVAWHPDQGVGGFLQRDASRSRPMDRLTLRPPGPHRVRIVDPAGRPVAGLEVRIGVNTDDSDWIASGELEQTRARTDDQGVAALPWVPRQKLKYVEVDPVGPDWKVDDIDLSRVEAGLTTVVVRRVLAVEGRLVMPAGARPEGILISGSGFGPANHGAAPCARARADGSFTLRVPSGHAFVLGITDSEWASDLWSGAILATDTAKPAEVVIEAYPATPLSVRVSRGARHVPVVDAWVQVGVQGRVGWIDERGKKQTGIGGPRTWWKTDAHGIARGGIGKGKHQVTLAAGLWREERPVEATSDDPIELVFHRAWEAERRIAGRLLRDGAPFQPSPALIAHAWTPRGRLKPLEFEPSVRPNGAYEVQFDAENLALFFHDPQQHRSGFVQIVNDGAQPDVVMNPTATYGGTLLDARARPIANQKVALRVKDSVHDASPAQRTDGAGRFLFSEAPARVPLQLIIVEEPGMPSYFIPAGERLFEPGETRDNDRVSAVRIADEPAPAVRPAIPIADRMSQLSRDARLSGMHVVVIVEGDSSPRVIDVVDRLMEGSKEHEIYRYLPERVDASRSKTDAAVFDRHNWPRPGAGEVGLIALDGDSKTLGATRIATARMADAIHLGREFLRTHAPPSRDARAQLIAARKLAGATGRRVWIIEGGPRCGACFRLARWIDDHSRTLEKDFVLVKLMSDLDSRVAEVVAELRGAAGGIPWHAFTEPDGKVLATSEGPLGNIGFPSSVEDVRHFRTMLERSARQLTAAEVADLIHSLANDQ